MIEEARNVDLWLYADDTELFKEIKEETDLKTLQDCIDNLQYWSERALQKFHPDKCEVMRIESRPSNLEKCEYNLNGEPLKNVTTVKDLGITFENDLSFEIHINQKVNKANSLFGLIRRSFNFLDCDTFKKLFTGVVRPHLEYGACVWNPHHRYLITLIENVQRRATKKIPGLADMTYQERLKKIGMPTLLYRRYRGDMIEVYKLIQPTYDPAVANDFLRLRKVEDAELYELRGHSCMLRGERFFKDVKKYSFRNRTVNQWNCLPHDVVNAPSLNSFKQKLDAVWQNFAVMFDSECDILKETTKTTQMNRRIMNLAQ